MVIKERKYLMCIIGAFAFGTDDTGGQPLKTRELYYALCEKFGKGRIAYVETVGWKKHPFKLIVSFIYYVTKCKCVVMLPAHNGVEVFARLLVFIKKFYDIKIFYDVIGGWLAEKISRKPRLKKKLLQFDAIWVETQSMRNELAIEKLNNVYVLNNFKDLLPIARKENRNLHNPIKLCTFSRVVKEKGIEDAINAIVQVNSTFSEIKYTLDIYGKVYKAYEKQFYDIINRVPNYINYKGIISSKQSSIILADYDILLFPTHYFTEGIPGTIIDAYAAGLPVIASKWKSFSDVVDEGKTGFGYKFGSYDDFVKILYNILNNNYNFKEMSNTCLRKSTEYTTNYVMDFLYTFIKD